MSNNHAPIESQPQDNEFFKTTAAVLLAAVALTGIGVGGKIAHDVHNVQPSVEQIHDDIVGNR